MRAYEMGMDDGGRGGGHKVPEDSGNRPFLLGLVMCGIEFRLNLGRCPGPLFWFGFCFFSTIDVTSLVAPLLFWLRFFFSRASLLTWHIGTSVSMKRRNRYILLVEWSFHYE